MNENNTDNFCNSSYLDVDSTRKVVTWRSNITDYAENDRPCNILSENAAPAQIAESVISTSGLRFATANHRESVAVFYVGVAQRMWAATWPPHVLQHTVCLYTFVYLRACVGVMRVNAYDRPR